METIREQIKPSNAFTFLAEAIIELEKMMPTVCEMCGNISEECNCEDPYYLFDD
jgi:hypothetical protein